jgi:hypothetical protein
MDAASACGGTVSASRRVGVTRKGTRPPSEDAEQRQNRHLSLSSCWVAAARAFTSAATTLLDRYICCMSYSSIRVPGVTYDGITPRRFTRAPGSTAPYCSIRVPRVTCVKRRAHGIAPRRFTRAVRAQCGAGKMPTLPWARDMQLCCELRLASQLFSGLGREKEILLARTAVTSDQHVGLSAVIVTQRWATKGQ